MYFRKKGAAVAAAPFCAYGSAQPASVRGM